VYPNATVANYYYSITVTATNVTATGSAADTRQNLAPALPTATFSSFAWGGTQGGTASLPTWTWTYGGGAATSFAWSVFGDTNSNPTTLRTSGTTGITTYQYPLATVAGFYYKITVTATNVTGSGSFSNTQFNTPQNISATGGTIQTTGGVRYHTFTTNGTFQIISNTATPIPVNIFAIGGGGGGGAVGGGGGAGGIGVRAQLIFASGQPTQIGSYGVVIGNGGNGASVDAAGNFTNATNGLATTITNPQSQQIICQGGQRGASADFFDDGTTVQVAGLGGGGSNAPANAAGGPTALPTTNFPLAANITYFAAGWQGGSGVNNVPVFAPLSCTCILPVLVPKINALPEKLT
jgi:hypothetical protein